jgi:ABC-type multidrug transport system fused ATPase/permease subunit
MSGYSISQKLFTHYLNQPYHFFLQHNSSHLSKNILAEVQILVQEVLIPIMNLMAQSLVTISILILLLIINPFLAIIAAFVLGGAYGLIYKIFHKRARHFGHLRQISQAEKYKVVNEALQGIKNIKLTAHESTYQHYFKQSSRSYADSMAKAGAIGEIPRYAIEMIGFGGLLLIILYLLLAGQELDQALPLVALYAFAGYRLMPSLQIMYFSLTKIRFGRPILDTITAELERAQPNNLNPIDEKKTLTPLPFHKSIKLSCIFFKYDKTKTPVLRDISIAIPTNTTTGIIGKTGSGKTTLVDIILGLLLPNEGQIHVDGSLLTEDNMQEWQQNLAYVSQHIYLCDDTVKRNIAFGVANEDIDEDQVKLAARMACIDELIEEELPAGYNTVIGENGMRLSGGQRQRIGLARALYLNRPVLVLDEATSALDTETEDNVMKAIDGLTGTKTIIIIAHRLTTVEKCDQLIKLDKGKIV